MSSKVTRKELRDALDPVFAAIGSKHTNLDDKNSKGKLPKSDVVYEAYVYALVMEVLERMGCHPTGVPNGSKFYIRKAPGELRTTPSQFSYVEFTRGGKQYELHVDTYYAVRHGTGKIEVDVSVTPKTSADAVRSGSAKRPGFVDLYLLLEAKHYGQSASTTPAKTYLGMCFQLHTAGRPESLVLSGAMTGGSGALVTGANYTVNENITPLTAHKANVSAFGSAIEAGLKAVL